MSFKVFMSNIGAAFSRGLKNGNLQKGIGAVSALSLGAGMTGMMIHEMKHGNNRYYGGCCNNSIFPFNNYGYYGGYNNFYGFNSMDCGVDYFSKGAMDAAALYEQKMAQSQYLNTNSSKTKLTTEKVELEDMDYDYAGDISADQDKKLGKEFDKASDKREYKFKGSIKSGDDYRDAVSELGKSYGAVMDSDKDGSISLGEYVKYESAKAETDTQKQQLKQRAQIAFKKFDMNGDKKLDWKELASAITTYDTNESGKLEGHITKDKYEKWVDLLASPAANEFDTTIRDSYKKLFDEE